MYGITRGERNNNPCNVRISNNSWIGKRTPSQDESFEQFDTALDGIRAGAKILVNYYKFHGLSTIATIITRWAPQADNNPTDAYIANVCKHMGIQPDDQLDMLDVAVLASLVTAVIDQENGRCEYDPDLITQACQEVV
jgi:hypothetical protein